MHNMPNFVLLIGIHLDEPKVSYDDNIVNSSIQVVIINVNIMPWSTIKHDIPYDIEYNI